MHDSRLGFSFHFRLLNIEHYQICYSFTCNSFILLIPTSIINSFYILDIEKNKQLSNNNILSCTSSFGLNTSEIRLQQICCSKKSLVFAPKLDVQCILC